MKKLLNFWLAGIFLLLMAPACVPDLQEISDQLENDISIYLGTGILQNPATLQFIDVETGAPIPNVKAKVLVTDVENGIFTLLGKSELQGEGGFLNLGVRKTENLADPKRIKMRFDAPGYFPQVEDFVLRDTHTLLFNVYMYPESSSSERVAFKRRFKINPRQAFAFPVSNSPTNIMLRIAPGTVYRDHNGDDHVDGRVDLDLEYWAPTEKHLVVLQDRLYGVPFETADGQIQQATIRPLAYFEIDMFIGNREVCSFSRPMKIVVELQANTPNPFINRPLRDGDLLPVFSFDDLQQVWRPDGVAVVEERNGQLIAQFDVPHLSTWVLGYSNLLSNGGSGNECHLVVDYKATEDHTGNYTQVYRSVDTVITYLDTTIITVDTNGIIREERIVNDTTIYKFDTVTYTYSYRPSYTVYKVFPDCAGSSSIDLSSEINAGLEAAHAFYEQINATEYADLEFKFFPSVFNVGSPQICLAAPTMRRVTVQADDTIPVILDVVYETGFRERDLSNGDFLRVIANRERTTISRIVYPGENILEIPAPGFPILEQNNRFYADVDIELVQYDDCQPNFQVLLEPLCETFNGNAPLRFSVQERASSKFKVLATGRCPDSDLLLVPTASILFRPACADDNVPYAILASMIDGEYQGVAPLRMGQSYDFLLSLDSSIREAEDIEILNDSTVYLVDGTPFLVAVAGDSITVDFGEVELPQSLCDDL